MNGYKIWTWKGLAKRQKGIGDAVIDTFIDAFVAKFREAKDVLPTIDMMDDYLDIELDEETFSSSSNCLAKEITSSMSYVAVLTIVIAVIAMIASSRFIEILVASIALAGAVIYLVISPFILNVIQERLFKKKIRELFRSSSTVNSLLDNELFNVAYHTTASESGGTVK